MKNRLIALPLALMMLAFTSCLFDNEPVEKVYFDYLNVTTGGSNPEFESDFGNKFTVVSSFPADTFLTGERYYVEYMYGDTANHPTGEYSIDITKYDKVLLQNMVVWPKDSDDVWANSNFYDYQGVWLSDNYLNAILFTFAPVSAVSNSVELIRVKQYESATPTDTAPLLHFQLRHNAELVYPQLYAARYLSFPLDTLRSEFPAARRIRMEIVLSTITKKETHTLDFIPNESNRSALNALPAMNWLQVKPGNKLKALR